jgi:endo-1,4-beta-xylanase
MDVALPVDSAGHVLNPADLTRQAEIYGAIADTCLRYSGCTALQTWGFTDKYSWIGRFTHGSKGAPLLFNRRYQPKPAYEAFRQAITDAASRGGQRHAE